MIVLAIVLFVIFFKEILGAVFGLFSLAVSAIGAVLGIFFRD